eukprot:TRINITY_DN23805_c0_g1_i1.p1 TRINITY_DN23805_c0_g1~~TRINITY_DN23805_c0_g1_i1.p1  ORF type:complete len:828 (-),score=116.13 TRINITY_DN23805_c0_g1_i1:169-2526(-)
MAAAKTRPQLRLPFGTVLSAIRDELAGAQSPGRSPVNSKLWSPRKVTEFLQEPLVPVVQQRSTLLGPQTHRLPFRVMWSITLLTALAMAVVNFVTILAIEYTVRLKFSTMQRMIAEVGLGAGIAVLVGFSMMYSLCGVLLIELVAPSCGGSGLPENKCFLNGSSLPGFFTKRTLRVRVATVILSNAAGYPVGREGPTVVIGSNVAYLISEFLAHKYVQEWVDFSQGSTHALIVDEERLAEATRIACSVGGACGMAMIFNAPFGGFLYMFEEITSVSWPWELTFRVFVATMVCALVSYCMLNVCGKDIQEFVIYAKVPTKSEWTWNDVPWFVLMSALLGVLTSYHTRWCLFMSSVRSRISKKLQDVQPAARIIETVLYAGVCALVCSFAAHSSQCEKQGDSPLQYVMFNCEEGFYNPVASLLLNTSHSAVKLLFSGQNTDEIVHQPSIASFVAYYLLNVCLTGLPVPGGAFTATMLLGGLFGRFTGSLLRAYGLVTSVSGIYAVVGSAAMLCGFKQMTLAVVLIVIECVNDLSLGPIVMLAVSVSMMVNWLINEVGHDEEQIRRRKLPFLDGEPPCELDCVQTRSLCDDLPCEAVLDLDCDVGAVEAALKNRKVYDFPIVAWRESPTPGGREEAICMGLVTRPHLEAGLSALVSGTRGDPDNKDKKSRAFLDDPFKAKDTPSNVLGKLADQIYEAGSQKALQDLSRSCAGSWVRRIMDPTPYTIMEDMPAPRMFALFAKAGERACCVVSREGHFRGVISREGLIQKTNWYREKERRKKKGAKAEAA